MKHFFAGLLALMTLSCQKSMDPGAQMSATVHSNAFTEQLAAFALADSLNFPLPHGKVFAGSSTFTRWRDMASYFPGENIINRGFGGSMINDVAAQLPIYAAYQPAQLFFYCGINNIFLNQTSGEVFALFKAFHTRFKPLMPNTEFINLGLIISPRACREINPRTNLPYRATIENYNRLVREYLATQPQSKHVEMYSYFFSYPARMPNEDWFEKDGLHNINDAYRIWAYHIRKTF